MQRAELLIELHGPRRITRRRHECLHRRQSGLHHHLELPVLEVALPLAEVRARITPHGDRHAGVRQRLEIPLSLFERGLHGLALLTVPRLLLTGRIGQHRHLRPKVVDVAQEERIFEELRRCLIDELGQIACERRDVGNVLLLDLRNQLRIDVLVAHAVRNHVDVRIEEAMRILQVVEMRCDPKSPLVRLIDQRAVHRRRRVVGAAGDVDLDDVDVRVGVGIHP